MVAQYGLLLQIFQKSVAVETIDGMHLHISEKSFTVPAVSLSFNTCSEDSTSYNLTLTLVN